MKIIYILTLIFAVTALSACKDKDEYAIYEKNDSAYKNQADALNEPVKNPIKWKK